MEITHNQERQVYVNLLKLFSPSPTEGLTKLECLSLTRFYVSLIFVGQIGVLKEGSALWLGTFIIKVD